MEHHFTAHILDRDTHNLRRRAPSRFTVYRHSRDLCHLIDEPLPDLIHMTGLRVKILIDLRRCLAECSHARNVLRTGAHSLLLTAAVDDRFYFYLIADI